MRKIKFRIWDMDRKVMMGSQYVIFYDGDFYENFRDFEDGILIENIAVMQYIGLKDKNGVEIYEGDVVHLTSDEGVNYNALIVFKDGGFCAIDGTESDYSIRRYGLSRFDFNLEVIGNIYENPELLEEEE